MTPSALLRSPLVAWPTLALTCLALGVWISGVVLGAADILPLPWAVTLATIGAYLSFTTAHEAAHKAVARAAWINELVGHLASTVLTAPFLAFRYVHLEHHKHTNDPVLDPDWWSGQGPWWFLPFHWITQDLFYYRVYLGKISRRPPAERWGVLAGLGLIVGGLSALCLLGYGYHALLLWILPARIALTLLAFAFDYVPHRPHQVTAREDRYRATHIVRGPGLSLLFMGHNYHLIHHLYPGIPFYRYGKVWRHQRQDLLARGVREVTVLSK